MKRRTSTKSTQPGLSGFISFDASRLAGLFSLLILVLAPAAVADSDGYYCSGPGYIAIQFRSFNTPDLEAPHVLKLVVFDGEQGPRWAGEAEMTDFQPHWMRCDETGVVITGWGGGAWVRYVAGENGSGEFAVLDRDESAEKPFGPPNAVLKNLGPWAIPGTYELESLNPKFRYELNITAAERSGEGVLYRDHRSVLLQFDRQGRERNRLVLYEGTSEEPIH